MDGETPMAPPGAADSCIQLATQHLRSPVTDTESLTRPKPPVLPTVFIISCEVLPSFQVLRASFSHIPNLVHLGIWLHIWNVLRIQLCLIIAQHPSLYSRPCVSSLWAGDIVQSVQDLTEQVGRLELSP